MSAWDYGITWFSRVSVEPTKLVLDVPFVRDSVLRVTNGEVEDQKIEMFIRVATRAAEEATRRALSPQTRQLVANGFPCEYFVVPAPPFIELTGFDYYDESGEVQSLAGSPSSVSVVPSGTYKKAQLWPADGGTWPGTATREDAVTITYRCGYTGKSGDLEMIKTGMCLMIAELYKQSSLSIAGTSVVPAVLGLKDFWVPVP